MLFLSLSKINYIIQVNNKFLIFLNTVAIKSVYSMYTYNLIHKRKIMLYNIITRAPRG